MHGDLRSALATVQDSRRSEAERSHAVTRLGDLGDPEAVLPLAVEYGDSSGALRTALAYALGRLNAIEVLERQLSFADARARSRAAAVLALFHDPRATRALVGALQDNVADVRINAACALAAHGDPAALEALANRLKGDPITSVRAAAAQAIGETPGARARALLEAATRTEAETFVIILIERSIQRRIDHGEHEMREAV